jgi:hypothetical protein
MFLVKKGGFLLVLFHDLDVELGLPLVIFVLVIFNDKNNSN